MLGNDAMEFLKTLHNLDEIWKQHDDAEYNDRQLTQFAERYHEHKLKLLGIADVVGQSEQLKALDDLKQWCFETCQPLEEERLHEILKRL